MRIAFLQPPDRPPELSTYAEDILCSAKKSHIEPTFEFANSIDDSDVIVFLQSNAYKKHVRFIQYFKRLLLDNPEKTILCHSREDHPAGFLPGIYSGLNTKNFDASLHLSWPSPMAGNSAVRIESELYLQARGDIGRQRPYLFSFLGAPSDKIRLKLFQEYENMQEQGILVSRVDRWCNHSSHEMMSYAQSMLQSRFVLCPRGYSPYSHRIIEAMSLGSVPVIIADDWVPFSVPESGYYLRIPESKILKTHDILKAEDHNYCEMQATAKHVFLKYFRYRDYWPNALEQLAHLYRLRLEELTPKRLVRRLGSSSFYKNNNWTLKSRIRSSLDPLLRIVGRS